jgi:hypothetical protein
MHHQLHLGKKILYYVDTDGKKYAVDCETCAEIGIAIADDGEIKDVPELRPIYARKPVPVNSRLAL